ncbi:MAG: hypothetical protein HQL72_10910 [Magnetococcales bacterium]|nr:hypothetical protein [Magnetococcales bacterium]
MATLSLVDELVMEHQKLFDAFREVESLGINSPEGREKLVAIGDFLGHHIRKEDAGIYSLLEKVAERDSDVMMLLYRTNRDLEDVSQEVNAFFKRCANLVDKKISDKHYFRIKKRLKERVDREEIFIFETFNKVVSQYFDGHPEGIS